MKEKFVTYTNHKFFENILYVKYESNKPSVYTQNIEKSLTCGNAYDHLALNFSTFP